MCAQSECGLTDSQGGAAALALLVPELATTADLSSVAISRSTQRYVAEARGCSTFRLHSSGIVLGSVASACFALAYAVSPRYARHPYLVYAAALAGGSAAAWSRMPGAVAGMRGKNEEAVESDLKAWKHRVQGLCGVSLTGLVLVLVGTIFG